MFGFHTQFNQSGYRNKRTAKPTFIARRNVIQKFFERNNPQNPQMPQTPWPPSSTMQLHASSYVPAPAQVHPNQQVHQQIPIHPTVSDARALLKQTQMMNQNQNQKIYQTPNQWVPPPVTYRTPFPPQSQPHSQLQSPSQPQPNNRFGQNVSEVVTMKDHVSLLGAESVNNLIDRLSELLTKATQEQRVMTHLLTQVQQEYLALKSTLQKLIT